jgi:hypothetical protein
MSWGLGRIQRGCLRVIDEYEGAGRKPTTSDIAAKVYRVRQDYRGNCLVSDAQHAATERALAALVRKGLVARNRHLEPERSGGRNEPCCFWSIVGSDVPRERPQHANDVPRPVCHT